MKILQVLEATQGGIRRHVVDLSIGLREKGHDVCLIFSSQRADAGFLRSLTRMKDAGVELKELNLVRNISVWSDLKGILFVSRFLRDKQPDILHLHGAKAGAIGRIAWLSFPRAAIVYTPHGGSFHLIGERKGFVYYAVEKMLSFIPSHYIGVSGFACRQILHGIRISEERIHLIYNGIDAVVEAPPKDRIPPGGRCTVLFPAVFLPAKGHIEFLTALAANYTIIPKDLRFVLAGDGPLKPLIENCIKENNLSEMVEVRGFVEDMEELYAGATVVILPSRNEAFPYVLLEAMAAGKSVLATSVGGIPEAIIDTVNGELFSVNAIETMVTRLAELSQSRQTLAEMGSRGRERVRTHFSYDHMVALTEELYLRINPASTKMKTRGMARRPITR